jgi:signal transduction histidine kinase
MDSLAAARNQDRRIVFRAWLADDQRLMLEVEDNGLGIPSRNLRRIFEHGFTTKQNGHGFGLHGCTAAAKEMGGNLRAHSNGENLGATFTLDLPFTPVPSAPTDVISQTGR